MPKAYSYIRFSTPEQLKGDSLRRQTELSEQFALENNLELDINLNLKDLGISAYDKSNITKGALGVFLKLIEEGSIAPGSYLLVESLDRLSRAQVLDALQVFMGILNAGITIVTLADKVTYTRQSTNDNWVSLIMSLIIMSRASEESLTKSKRQRAAWDNKRANIHNKKLTARCPYWLTLNDDKTGFIPIPERVETVRKIFSMAKDGFGNSIITKRLNEQKEPTFSKNTDGWQPTYIQKVLTNKAVYGEFSLSLQRNGEIKKTGTPIENYYPPIIAKDEWLLVNERRAQRKTKGGVSKGQNLSNIFSGLLYCAYCNGPMVMGGYTKKSLNNLKLSRKYVGCSKARRGLGCHFMSWNYESLESEILQFCYSLDFSQALGKTSKSIIDEDTAAKNILSIESEIQANEIKMNNLVDVLANTKEELHPQVILQKINQFTSLIESLNEEKIKAIEYLNKVKLVKANKKDQYENIVEVIKKLREINGSDLHDLRIKLSEQVKRAISKIILNPAGHWKSAEQMQNLKEKLEELEYPPDRINSYLSGDGFKPNKNDRYLSIIFANGEILSISGQKVLSKGSIYSRDNFLETIVKNQNYQ